MESLFYSVFGFVIIIGSLIFFHESGHFVAAKLCGMDVGKFALGFGPVIWKKSYKGTEFSIRCIPLGGYNDIKGMDEKVALDDLGAFCNKKIWQRFVTVAAGAFMNFFVAFVLYFLCTFIYGEIKPSHEPVVGDVVQSSAAMNMLQSGDRLLRIDDAVILDWDDIAPALKDKNEVEVEIERYGENFVENIVLSAPMNSSKKVLGISPTIERSDSDFISSIGIAGKKTYYTTLFIARTFVSLFQHPEMSKELAGIVEVARTSGEITKKTVQEVAGERFENILLYAALISINLGFVNLLPVPALDGWHLMLIMVECITGAKLSMKNMLRFQYVGFSFFALLMVFTLYQDIMRIFDIRLP